MFRLCWIGLALVVGCTVEETKAPDDTGSVQDTDTGGETDTDTDTDSDSDTDSDTDSDSDSDSDTDTDTDLSELPDLSEGLDTTVCEDAPGYEDLAGATSYFVGLYVSAGGTWEGTERWLLYPTSEWEAAGGEACEVVWDVSASETSPESCPSCELAIDVSATVREDLSTCPAALYSDDETWSVGYDIDLRDDGTVNVYFASSGNLLGTGYGDATAFTYLTDASCNWF